MISEKSVTDFFIQSLLTQRHSSLATCSVYRYEINCFFDYLKQKNLDFKTISSSEIDDYLIENAKKRKISSSTSSRVITVLKLFFSFALEHNWRKDDPTELTGDVKHAKKLPSVIQENQIEKFLSSIDITGNTGKRDRAMFELIYSCGLRVSECCNLKIKDYYPEEKRIVVTGKGNKQRMIPVGEYAIDAIQEYFEESRPQLLNHKKSDYVFISNKKKGITRQEVWVRLKHYAKIANLDLKVHTLRHSFASQLLRNGADLKSIQEFLGHSDIKTTEIYTHVNTEDLYQAFKKSHPLQTDKKQQV